MLPMPAFAEVEALIRKTYDTIWREWYRTYEHCVPAILEVPISDHAAGYSHSRNTIWDPILEGNLDDYDTLDAEAWPVWKIQLVHEMLHEYQHKAVSAPSQQGTALCQLYQKTFWGDGHDERFFTAIAEKAPYFGMTPEQLIKRL
jgi:hypothetical protein